MSAMSITPRLFRLEGDPATAGRSYVHFPRDRNRAAPMMRNEPHVLLDKVQNEAPRADMRTEIDRLKKRRSDLREPEVRDAVLAFEGAKVTTLSESDIAKPYS